MNKKIFILCTIALLFCFVWITCNKNPTSPEKAEPRTYVLTSANSFFEDVPLNHWSYDYIKILFDKGYIFGRSDKSLIYEPDATLTRAEIAVFIVRGAHGVNFIPEDPEEQLLADVPLDHWAAKWVTQLYNDGYSSGTGEKDELSRPYYHPESEITRAEACVYFVRLLKGVDYVPDESGEKIFSDVETDQWYAKWIETAYFAKLTCPYRTYPRYEFEPLTPITRAMTAYMLAKAKKFEPQQNTNRDVSKEPIGKDIRIGNGLDWEPYKIVNLASQIRENHPNSQYEVFDPDINDYVTKYGSNLCGQICLSMILETITGEKYKLIEIYNAVNVGNYPTTASHLINGVTKLFPSGTKTESWDIDKEYGYKLRYAMNLGHYLITLHRFKIYNQWCMLATVDNDKNTYHWITITGFIRNWDSFNDESGLNWIRINNPFNNRVEYYPFRDFMESIDGLKVLEIYQ